MLFSYCTRRYVCGVETRESHPRNTTKRWALVKTLKQRKDTGHHPAGVTPHSQERKARDPS